jgi:hypothetical protein
MVRLLLIAVLVVASGCGGAPTAPFVISSPTATESAVPPPTSPPPGNLTAWSGNRTLTGVTGGDCVGQVLAASIGSASTYDLRVTENGSSLTAVATDRMTGFTVNYAGTADGSSILLEPHGLYSPGSFPFRNYPCGGGQVRYLELNTSTITATVSGNTVTGTVVDEFYVAIASVAGTTTSLTYVGEPLVLNWSFVLTR